MGKTLIFTDVDYSENAISPQDLHRITTYDNTDIWGMVTSDTTNKYVNYVGEVISNNSFCYVMIDIEYYSKIIISGYCGSTIGSFYTGGNPSTSTFLSSVTKQSEGNISNYEVNIPNGAKYFALNLWKNKDNYSFTKTN